MTCNFLVWILIDSSVSSIKNSWSWRSCFAQEESLSMKIKVGLHMLRKFLTFSSFCPPCFSHLVPFSLVRSLMAGFQGNKPGQRHWRLASSENANCSTVILFGLDQKIINNISIAKCTIDPRVEYFRQKYCPNKPGTSQFDQNQIGQWNADVKLLPSCQVSPTKKI